METASPARGRCKDLKFWVNGESYVINCYGLALGSYNMVLGVQWLESLDPFSGISVTQ
jgi:hypothetical protein